MALFNDYHANPSNRQTNPLQINIQKAKLIKSSRWSEIEVLNMRVGVV